MVKCEVHGEKAEDELAAGEPSQEELAAIAKLEEEETARILREKTLELGQTEEDLEMELRGAPEDMLLEAENEEPDEEDCIPPTQPDPVTPVKETPGYYAASVQAELEATAASVPTEKMDSEDVRKKQLSMRALEREKKEAAKAAKEKEKEEAKKNKAAAKAKGRPRKKDAPLDPEATPAMPAKRLKRKTTVEMEQDLEEMAKETADAAAKSKKNAKNKGESGKAGLKEKDQEKSEKKKKKEELSTSEKKDDKETKKKPAAKKTHKKEEDKDEKKNEVEDGQKPEKKRKEKKLAEDAAVPAKRHRGGAPAGGDVAAVDPNLKTEMIGVIKSFENKEYDKKGDTLHHGKYGDDVQMVVYWSRATVGVKLRLGDGLAQRYYYSIKGASIALNIFTASKICAKLQENGVEWHRAPEALQFDKMLRATAIAAVQGARG